MGDEPKSSLFVQETDEGAPVGVWVFLAFYLVFLISVAAWSFLENRKLADGTKTNMKRTKSKLEEHYVASRDLGPWSLALTLLASTWSGYTVVGAPEYTYKHGWNATRYMGGFVITQSTMLLVCARMQWYAFKRQYVSTVDFISDRYRSHFTRLFVSFAQLLATVLYVMGQFKSIGATINGMSNDQIPAIAAAAVMCFVMLAYEFFGGMRAVALTDLVQGIILIFGCCLYFVIMETVFPGGISRTTEELRACSNYAYDHKADDTFYWDDATDTPCLTDLTGCTEYPYIGKDEAATRMAMLEGCPLTGYTNGESDDFGATDAINLMTIDREDDLASWLPFYVAGISFPIYPQILVRFYTARNVNHLRWGMYLTHVSVFYLCLPAFLTGYTAITRNLPGLAESNADQAFSKIMLATITDGPDGWKWFFYISGCCTTGAAVAAYMSTADSALMAASSMVTLDLIRDYGMNKPTSDDQKRSQETRLYIIAKIVSIVFGVIAVILSPVKLELARLYEIQGAILMISCPAYLFGMYNKRATAFSVNMGIIIASLVFIPMWCYNSFAVDEDAGDKPLWLPDVIATMVNIGATLMFMYLPPFSRFSWANMKMMDDDVYDPDITPNFLSMPTTLDKRVVGVDCSKFGGMKLEPIRPLWVNFIVFLLLFIAIPFWHNLPTSWAPDSFSGAMPTWAVASTLFAAVAMVINMFQTRNNWSDWITEDGEENINYILIPGEKPLSLYGPVDGTTESDTNKYGDAGVSVEMQDTVGNL